MLAYTRTLQSVVFDAKFVVECHSREQSCARFLTIIKREHDKCEVFVDEFSVHQNQSKRAIAFRHTMCRTCSALASLRGKREGGCVVIIWYIWIVSVIFCFSLTQNSFTCIFIMLFILSLHFNGMYCGNECLNVNVYVSCLQMIQTVFYHFDKMREW